ncbi:hypothetical protein Pfo_024780, partial [Paulownia fortunei]
MFVQQYKDKYVQKNDQKRVEIGQKRRLTMSPSMENLQNVLSVAIDSDQHWNYTSQDQEELVDVQEEMETLFSAALDDESSSDVKDSLSEAAPSASDTSLNPITEDIWEKLLGEDLIADDEAEENLAADQITDVEVEDLVAKTPYWGEDLQDLKVAVNKSC